MGALSVGASPIEARRARSSAQLALIRRTVARALSEPEFEHFLEVAAAAGLDPLRRQIVPLVLQADDIERRRMIPWTTIDGLRVIAARAGDYRPMEEAPHLEIDADRIDPATNPLGLLRAEVRVWKRSGETWHPVAGEAWWDEYAPVSQRRVQDAAGGPATAVIELDPSWRRMARVMLAKCAEAQALRRGWPDLLSGLYAEDELHRMQRDAAAARAVQRDGQVRAEEVDGRGSAYLLCAGPGAPLEAVPAATFPQRLRALYGATESIEALDAIDAINRAALQTFWSRAPSEALEIKGVAEARRADLFAEGGRVGPGGANPLRADPMVARKTTAAPADNAVANGEPAAKAPVAKGGKKRSSSATHRSARQTRARNRGGKGRA